MLADHFDFNKAASYPKPQKSSALMRYLAGSVALMTPKFAFAADSLGLNEPSPVPFLLSVLLFGGITYGIVSHKLKKYMEENDL